MENTIRPLDSMQEEVDLYAMDMWIFRWRIRRDTLNKCAGEISSKLHGFITLLFELFRQLNNFKHWQDLSMSKPTLRITNSRCLKIALIVTATNDLTFQRQNLDRTVLKAVRSRSIVSRASFASVRDRFFHISFSISPTGWFDRWYRAASVSREIAEHEPHLSNPNRI